MKRLMKWLPFTFNLPDFQGTPFTLVCGRLVFFDGSPAAELVFALRKHQISAFILRDQSQGSVFPGAVSDLRKRGFSVESWSESGTRYVLVGDASPADLAA